MIFSFIIPLYNCEKYIVRCVRSILKMERSDIEVILINDGSQDQSESICLEQFQNCKNVYYYSQSNQGVAIARNNALKKAKGRYIIFIDSDDCIDSERMNKLLDDMGEKADVDLAIYGMSFDYYKKKECYRRDILKSELVGVLPKKEWIQKLDNLYGTNSLNSLCNKIIKKEIIMQNNLTLRENMILYEDLEFSLRCMAYCDEILFSPEVIYHYRQSEDEGNAGRRLKRIPRISALMEQIENAFFLLQQKNLQLYDIEIEKNSILLKLYLVLAREKIAVSSRREIKEICREFNEWRASHQIESDDKFFTMLVNEHISMLILKRRYSLLRHSIAVKVKKTKWYQKKHSQ